MSKSIITIAREYGSGGREIGERLANDLNFNFYDKQILEKTAEKSGFCEEIIKKHDEVRTSSFLSSLVLEPYNAGYPGSPYADVPFDQKVFLTQYEVIKKMAENTPCIFVGRCADYILKDVPGVISVFITADNDYKTKRVMERHDLTEKKAMDLIAKKNKQRAAYYNYYTNKKWGSAKCFDLCIDSSKFGIERAIEIIKYAII